MPKANRIFRLNATQLNNLNLSYMSGPVAIGMAYNIENEIDKSSKSEVSYKKFSQDESSIFVFQAVSDIKNPQKRQNLAYVNDVIQQFEQNNSSKKTTTLLIPLMQSRLWKGHCVLVEVTITESKKEINIHDSQSWWRNLFYPNSLKDLKKQDFQVEYTNYGKQKDNYSCVYYVHQFIQKILGNNVEKPIKEILRNNQFDSLNTLEGEDPIGKLIYKNFKRKYPDVRDIESGETIPWKANELKDHFEQKFTQYTEYSANTVVFGTSSLVDYDANFIKNKDKQKTKFGFAEIFTYIVPAEAPGPTNDQRMTYGP